MNKKSESSTTNINYKGVVTVDVVSNKGKIKLSSKKYYNEGKLPLFLYLAMCLAGDYARAESKRPKYLNLFSAGTKGYEVTTIDIDGKNGILADSDNSRLAVPIIYEGTPATVPEGEFAKTTLKFKLPLSQLGTQGGEPPKDINLFTLSGVENRNIPNEPSAYFLLTETEENTTKLGSLISDDISSDKDYTIFIQWELYIKG